MDENKLVDKFRGCLLGVAVGDALGMPVEIMRPEEILAVTGGQGVTGYLAPQQDKFERTRDKILGTRKLPPGGVTDDTMLSFAVARSLIGQGDYDHLDQVNEFLEEFDRSTLGWGRATQTSAAEIKLWLDTSGASGRDPLSPAAPPSKPGQGSGNGVAMKIAPLALFHALRHGFLSPEFHEDALRLGRMTHGDFRASFSAIAVGDAISVVLNCDPYPKQGLNDAMLRWILEAGIADEERRHEHEMTPGDLLSERLKLMFRSLGSADTLRQQVGTGCHCLESVPFAIGVFLRHPNDFRAAVLEAVNAGGDTDSTASMVGAMVGANLGLAGIPTDLQNGCLARDEAIKLADDLYAVAKA
jgi:ADP-ribosylglycohydrolase